MSSCIRRPGVSDEQHIAMLNAILEQHSMNNNKAARRAQSKCSYTVQQAQKLEEYYWACPATSSQVSVRVPGERDIRPTFTYGGLKRWKAKNWHEFHSAMAHMGAHQVV